jgi:hypothetical protein
LQIITEQHHLDPIAVPVHFAAFTVVLWQEVGSLEVKRFANPISPHVST